MLRILGSRKELCGGITRREMLWAGGLGMFGLGLADFLRLAEVQGADARGRGPGVGRQGGEARSTPAKASSATGKSFGRAKSCILLYLYGSPSQLETFDMKPGAPLEIRGDLKPISSSVPELDVCELLPRTARVMDRVTVVRSMSHPYPIHGVAYALTGIPQIEVAMELSPHDPRHWPFVGSVVDYVSRQKADGRRQWAEGSSQKKGQAGGVPDNIALPFPFSTRRVGEVARAGPYAAFLGGAHDPLWTEFHGEATRSVVKTLADQRLDVREPYMGITPASRFELATSTRLPAEMTLDRLNRRRTLLDQFDLARRDLERTGGARTMERHREMAYGLIASDQVHAALDLEREPLAVRESYGMTVFGQAALAARRLVEAGSRFVSVFWDEYGLAGSGWDTHWEHYPRMKDELLPGFDLAFSGLIEDLDQRGLLDETLVLCVSEHGRTPKITNARGGGRDHWSECYSAVFAGGGVARGRVIGKSDAHAAYVLDRPVSPKDILATVYHLLGIDPKTTLFDRTGRPVPLVAEGDVVGEMLG